MYHISDDIRAKTSAMRICEAVMSCAKQKPISEITITELSRNHLISRTTFYRLFDNVSDVLEYQCDLIAQEILLNIHGDSHEEVLLETIRRLIEQKDLIEILSCNGRMGLIKTMQEKYLPKSILLASLDTPEQSAFFHSILAMLIPAALDAWIQDGQKESPEEIYKELQNSLHIISSLVDSKTS